MIQRTVLVRYAGEVADAGPREFRVERWFVPLSGTRHESAVRFALIWDTGGEQACVLLSPDRAREVAALLAAGVPA